MCPKCNEPLIVVEFRGVEIDHCLECHGTWFDAGELEFVLELAGVEPDVVHKALDRTDRSTTSNRRCPRCGRKMRLTQVGRPPVEVDMCRTGEGIWLDAGELGALVRGLGDHGDAPSAALAEFFGELFRHELTGETEVE